MDSTVVVAIIGLIEAVGVALIGGMLSRANKRSDDYRRKVDERETARVERDAALYDLVFASASGTEVLLHQAHGDHINGNVEEALDSIRNAKSECNRVFNHQVAEL